MGDLYRETKRVEALIQHAGCNLIVKWECEWVEDINYVENISLFVGKFNRVDPILPRRVSCRIFLCFTAVWIKTLYIYILDFRYIVCFLVKRKNICTTTIESRSR